MHHDSVISWGGINTMHNLHVRHYLEGNLICIMQSSYIPKKGEKLNFDENFYIVSDVVYDIVCDMNTNPKVTKINIEVEEY